MANKDDWKSSQKLTEAEINQIFNTLDTNKKGWLSVEDFIKWIARFGHANASIQASIVFKSIDTNGDRRIYMPEFKEFVKRKEEKLFLFFETFDTNNDGKITSSELALVLQMEAHTLSSNPLKESDILMSRISKNGSNSCSFRDFTEAFLLFPTIDNKLVFEYWTKRSHLDIGEDYVIPDEPSIEKSRMNIFISGAFAGCLSRTVTAPLDRVKVIMQAGKGDANIIHCLDYMYKEGGYFGYWRGNGINCIKIGPESAVKFLA